MKCIMNNLTRLLFIYLAIQLWISPSLLLAEGPTPTENSTKVDTGSEQSTGSGGESVLPDLFTGTMSYQVPIEVPPGRNGLQPLLALKYRSSNGNGWIGMGWELEVGAIERSTRTGVDYTKDNFVFRRTGGISDLVSVGNGSFRSKIESDFMSIQRQSDGSFIAIDKVGTKYYFGRTDNSRIAGLPGTFKWSLDRVEDTSGNFITYTYQNNGKGQIYLDHIDYNGNQIKFYLEGRDDRPELYTAGFLIWTSKRLKFIHVISANGTYTRSYKLSYMNSIATGRSNLASVQQFGMGATLDADGNITNEDSLSKLPAQTFSINNQANGFTDQKWADTAIWTVADLAESHTGTGDFNGDGKSDIISVRLDQIYIIESKCDQGGNNFFKEELWPTSWVHSSQSVIMDYPLGWIGYFNDDVRMDMVWGTNVEVSKSDASGNGYFDHQVWKTPGTWGARGYNWAGDFNGDGRIDMASGVGSKIYVRLSKLKPDGTDEFIEEPWPSTGANWGSSDFTWIGDFNGDGLPDIATRVGNTIWVKLNKNGSFEEKAWATPANWGDKDHTWIGDFNGDGRTDIATRVGNVIWVNISKVDASGNNIFVEQKWTTSATHWGTDKPWVGDFNGDGLPDIATRIGNTMYVYLSKGAENMAIWTIPDALGNYTDVYVYSGFQEQTFSTTLNWNNVGITRVGDFDGDGKADIVTAHNVAYYAKDVSGNIWVKHSDSFPVDKIIGIDNGIGGHIDIEYTPSTRFTNTALPFPVQVVTKITRNNTEVTTIDYDGGYFYMPEKDFRGFHHVTVKGPVGPNNEQQITETWFHQGKDLDVDVNVPKVATGYMKGKPYRVRIIDGSGYTVSETETVYAAQKNVTSPWYFNPPAQVDTYTCDGNSVVGECKGTANVKHNRTNYVYDNDSSTEFGNLSYESRYNDYDNPNDDLTIYRTYSPNESKWIVGLPTSEKIYQGIGTSNKIAETTYYYDGGVTNCTSASVNQYPDKGLLTRTVRWLHYEGDPDSAIEERMAYDSYGNPVCRGDARNYTTTIGYDPSNTFPLTITSPPTTNSPAGLVTTTTYYGVNAVTGPGLYGQVQSVTDPNNASTYYEYDSLGRPKKQTLPDGTSTSWTYNNFGTVDTQNVRTDTSGGLWTENYFDGFGRTVLTKSKGPDSKIIATDTIYDRRGAVRKTSFPYFLGTEKTPPYVVTDYDSVGRVTQTEQESSGDPIRTLTCYNNNVTVKIDPNNHRRREVRDASGRLTTVQEYKGTFTSCGTEPGDPYATTTYEYDVLGNLRFVTNAKSNRTEMRYDSLGRKRYMNDPDMGGWSYTYDGNGNLITQTDAKQQTITYGYDSLNRNIFKKFGSSTVVTNYYDEATSGNSKGRLSRMIDGSGQTVYNHDNVGRISSATKTISGTSYTLGFAYVNGRLDKITYPDNDTVSYFYYGDGNLKNVGNYVTYSNYDALGRPLNAAYGTAGASSLFIYDSVTNRLKSITVFSPNQGPLLDNTYDYDNKGNIAVITDNLNNSLPMSFSSESYSIYPGKAHAPVVIGRSFQYDSNGNMTSNGQQSIAYDFENMPLTIGNVSFAYDGSGARVKKSSPGVSTHYIDKLYECTNGVCAKYIYAGDERVALKSDTVVLYFHPDHQGSTAVVTDAAGNLAENISYYPFGGTRLDNSPFTVKTDVKFKYTGQELDAETGFYNYGARLYDPSLARFLTPDSIVPDPENPQSFNRYAYVQNNPVNRIDPSGNFDFGFGGFNFCFFDCGGNGGGGGRANSSFVANDYTFRDNAVMNFYITPESNYNNPDNTTGPGYSGGYSSSPFLLATVPGQQHFDNTVNALRNHSYVSAALNGTAMVAEQLMFVASLGSTSLESSSYKVFSTNLTKQSSTGKMQSFFPTNQGFLGQPSRQYLLAGEKIDRYGGIASSRFFSPSGTAIGARALPPGTTSQALRVFEVIKPFEVEVGRIAPAYGELGLGIQYRTPKSLEVLLKRGILKEVF